MVDPPVGAAFRPDRTLTATQPRMATLEPGVPGAVILDGYDPAIVCEDRGEPASAVDFRRWDTVPLCGRNGPGGPVPDDAAIADQPIAVRS
jgi:hypothetical protein